MTRRKGPDEEPASPARSRKVCAWANGCFHLPLSARRPALSPESKNFRPPGCRTSKLPAFILPIGIRTVKALATFGLQHGRVRRTVVQSGLAFPSATERQFDRFQPGGWTNSNSVGPGLAQPGSAVLNSVGLPVTYSTQSSRIIRCTSSALKPIPLGCLLPS